MGLLYCFAELEKELIKERTQVGLSSARGRGKLGGRPTIHANDKKKIAYQMVMENNQNITEIASALNMSRATIIMDIFPLHTNYKHDFD